MRPTTIPTIAAAAALTSIAAATPQYVFTLVDAFTPDYGLRECYIYDISDQNVACGTATIQNGQSITYTGFYWTP